MRDLLRVCACALALAGCQTAAESNYVAPPDAAAINAARRAVISSLKDPGSATFGPMRRHSFADPLGRKFDVVCGSVNAKNSFGGYTGQQQFAYNVELGRLYMSEGDQTDRLAVLSMCT